MPAASPYQLAIAHGEALDESFDVPLDYGDPADNPATDGSWFTAAFKAARDPASPSVLAFDTRAPGRQSLSIGPYDGAARRLAVSLQAHRDEIRKIAPGDYVCDLIHMRPRAGALGAAARRIAIINLTIEGGTS